MIDANRNDKILNLVNKFKEEALIPMKVGFVWAVGLQFHLFFGRRWGCICIDGILRGRGYRFIYLLQEDIAEWFDVLLEPEKFPPEDILTILQTGIVSVTKQQFLSNIFQKWAYIFGLVLPTGTLVT